jgi:hypothetical protein
MFVCKGSHLAPFFNVWKLLYFSTRFKVEQNTDNKLCYIMTVDKKHFVIVFEFQKVASP